MTGQVLPVSCDFSYGPRLPTAVPVLPGLNVGRSFYYTDTAREPGEPEYEPCGADSFSIHNGPRAFNHILTTGVWYLHVGDRPRMKMSHRGERGAYALPALLRGTGVGGELRVAIHDGVSRRWLDEMDVIDAVLSPGEASWSCRAALQEAHIELGVTPLVETFGYVATLRGSVPVGWSAEWVFGNVTDRGDVIVLEEDSALVTNPSLPFTEVRVGVQGSAARRDADQARFDAPLSGSTFVCTWGYRDYDRADVKAALARLDFKPFADVRWLESMKVRWFHHWIGRGLEPEKTFRRVFADPQGERSAASASWAAQRERVRISTPDGRFDTVVNNTAAALRMQYELPAFIHGVTWTKYGKINSGYYGCDAAGYHDEVADSLRLLTGTQDFRGRQRYFMPAFTISTSCEEQDLYFVEQAWHHYRWTGDGELLRALWPSVLRALEHALHASDPDGDGVFTGYYEQWNCDTHARGGRCALESGLAIAALRAAESMAALLGGRSHDTDSLPHVGEGPNPPAYLDRIRLFRHRAEQAFEKAFWNTDVGAWSSSEWHGRPRPRPEAMEQNYHVWRGVGEPMHAYMAMRYIRDSFHIRPAPGVELELINDWWPILWSHHYVANGDTAASFLSACAAGDVDGFWPALKTVTETAYRSDTATLTHGANNDGRGGGMRQLAEMEPMLMSAVVEGLFGACPSFGENLLVVRPNLPRRWDHASIASRDFTIEITRGPGFSALRVRTPVPRRVRVEIPVTEAVRSATVNGAQARFEQQSTVNACRVVVEETLGTDVEVRLSLGDDLHEGPASVDGPSVICVGEPAKVRVAGAVVVGVHDPQQRLGGWHWSAAAESGGTLTLTAASEGRCTIFLALRAGTSEWLHPLDLEARPSWESLERYLPAYTDGGPAVACPRVVTGTKSLQLELRNNRGAVLAGDAVVTLWQAEHRVPVSVPPCGTAHVEMDIKRQWSRLTPGSFAVDVRLDGESRVARGTSWDIPLGSRALEYLDLGPWYTTEITHLYGKAFQWRHDYTGGQYGIDVRDPVPPRDARGYVVMTQPVAQFEYQSVETNLALWNAHFEVEDFGPIITTPFGVTFRTGTRPLGPGAGGNILALACTEPYEQLPSAAVVSFPVPRRVEKIYLLSANLTKTVKCYAPGAEVILHYDDGTSGIEMLMPPYTMSCFAQQFSPRAFALPFGRIVGGELLAPLRFGDPIHREHLAVSDLLVDPRRRLAAVELRCVATETVLGIMGMSLLPAGE